MAADRAREPGSARRRFSWDRPRYRDKAFLAAVAITVGLVALQAVLVSERGTAIWYLNLAVRALITWIVVSAAIRIRVGIRRGLVRGFEESQRQAESRSGPTTADTVARASGRTLGRAIAAYKKTQQKP